MSVCCEYWVLASRSLRRTDHLSRGVIPSVMCLSVIEEPHRGGLGPLDVSNQEEKNIDYCLVWFELCHSAQRKPDYSGLYQITEILTKPLG
jgi:hypothetical protein